MSRILPDTLPLWRATVDQYHALIENGILGPEDRVELLEGLIVRKNSEGPDPTAVALRRAIDPDYARRRAASDVAVFDIEMLPLWHVSLDRYHAMIENGILGPEDRVELLEGLLVKKLSKNPPHSAVNDLASQAMQRVLPRGWWVRSQNPISLGDSEPEPDLAIVRGSPRIYLNRHPRVEDIGIVIEIADASLGQDRGFKTSLFAKAAIPGYWIVNLKSRRVEVYSNPQNGEYRDRTVYEAGGSIPVTLDGETVGHVAAGDLLP